MRQLTEEEAKAIFSKLAFYIGDNVRFLTENGVFRLQKNRIFFIRSLEVLNLAESIARDKLISVGTCLGKLTKSGGFRVHITALQELAPLAKYKVWLRKPQAFLYGNNALKMHVGRITETAPPQSGCIVFSMNEMPLGFGVLARPAQGIRETDPQNVVVLNQADIGEYLRDQDLV